MTNYALSISYQICSKSNLIGIGSIHLMTTNPQEEVDNFKEQHPEAIIINATIVYYYRKEE